jgi:hypothetical protein
LVFIHDFSNWPQSLLDFSIHQFESEGWLEFDSHSKLLSESDNANALRVKSLANDKYAFWIWRLKFGVAVECLLKAVFFE